jgi:predicted ester cyclase
MSVERTRAAVTGYLNAKHGDASMLSDDVVFTIMATGQEHRGPEAVQGMLNYFYHGAFDAKAETRTLLFGDSNALLEADFVGKHIGEFAGIPATGKEVHVPFCVVYDVAGDKITRGRVYMEMPVMMQQLGAGAP